MKWKVIKIIWGTLCVFAFIVMVFGIYVNSHPEKYAFGSEDEVPIEWYEAQDLYIKYDIAMTVWFVIGFLFCLLQHKFHYSQWYIIMHILLTLLYIFLRSTGMWYFVFF